MDTTTANKRLMAAVIQVAVFLAIGAFLGYQFQRQAMKDPKMRLEVAQQALSEGDDATAFKLFSQLADSGNARAQYWLADMYEYGYGVKKDIAKAIPWMEKAAGQGLATAQARLGAIYLAGQEAPQDFAKARTWLQKAADQHSAVAERRLGQMKDHGLGGAQDLIGAYVLYEQAILDGDGYATELRDTLVKRMSPAQISEAQTLVEKLNKPK